MVSVNMGPPRFAPPQIPFVAEAEAVVHVIDVDGEPIELSVLSMGNPHAVRLVCNLDAAPVPTLGAQIERHPRFPERVNVGFMQVVAPNEIHLRVHERGVGETPACGTGACGAVAVGRRWGLLEERVTVHLPGGELAIAWAGAGQMLYMTGPATHVFEGIYEP